LLSHHSEDPPEQVTPRAPTRLSLSWGSAEQFVFGPGHWDGYLGAAIQGSVCTDRRMPHAERTFDAFWGSNNPYQPGVLLDELDGLSGWDSDLQCPGE
jgi:hypothetical protein